jgi:hypothetical protein
MLQTQNNMKIKKCHEFIPKKLINLIRALK